MSHASYDGDNDNPLSTRRLNDMIRGVYMYRVKGRCELELECCGQRKEVQERSRLAVL